MSKGKTPITPEELAAHARELKKIAVFMINNGDYAENLVNVTAMVMSIAAVANSQDEETMFQHITMIARGGAAVARTMLKEVLEYQAQNKKGLN